MGRRRRQNHDLTTLVERAEMGDAPRCSYCQRQMHSDALRHGRIRGSRIACATCESQLSGGARDAMGGRGGRKGGRKRWGKQNVDPYAA